ncbi:MAG: DUF927 domain-containing protein, partial [Rhodospirillaceae bacterium]
MSTTAFAKPTADEIQAANETVLNAAANNNAANPEMDHNFVFPVPADAPPPPATDPKLGAPTHRWSYRDTAGSILCYVNRYDLIEDGQAKKVILPMVIKRLLDGTLQWVYNGMPAPRPLYNLHLIAANEDATIIVAEGEKAADAAGILFPGMVATTSMSGSNAADKTDWAPINGRHVVISPDADAPGQKYRDRTIALCHAAGAASVSVLPPERLGRFIVADGHPVPRGGEIPVGYDLADALAEGWTANQVAEVMVGNTEFFVPQAPKAASVPVPYAPPGFKVNKSGVWKASEGNQGELSWSKVCSQLVVKSLARDFGSKGWHMMLSLLDRDGVSHDLLLPLSDLSGDGNALREMLLNLGLQLNHSRFARNALLEYLSTANPPQRVRCVDRLGWHGNCYVMQDKTFGVAQEEDVIFKENGASKALPLKVSGSLADWQVNIARYAVGNSRLTLSICVAFAAPLLRLARAEGGGVHLYGGSSIGKTALLQIAVSVWGCSPDSKGVGSWRMTDNAAEGLARSRCDSLLTLDELAEVTAPALAALAYMLANGQGKGRATRTGDHRQPSQWLLLFLSTGEIRLETKLAEENKRVMAGMGVRIPELPADAGVGRGVFENLHDFETGGELWQHLNTGTKRYCGTAIREFLNGSIRVRMTLPFMVESIS